MIKRGRYKFVHSPVDPDQLYDLADDPDEVRNLAADLSHAQRVRTFLAEVKQRWNLPALHAEVLASQQRRHLVNDALRTGRYTAWDFQPLRDARQLYVRNDRELGDLESMARFRPSSPEHIDRADAWVQLVCMFMQLFCTRLDHEYDTGPVRRGV
jgi:choline-sulfatase